MIIKEQKPLSFWNACDCKFTPWQLEQAILWYCQLFPEWSLRKPSNFTYAKRGLQKSQNHGGDRGLMTHPKQPTRSELSKALDEACGELAKIKIPPSNSLREYFDKRGIDEVLLSDKLLQEKRAQCWRQHLLEKEKGDGPRK